MASLTTELLSIDMVLIIDGWRTTRSGTDNAGLYCDRTEHRREKVGSTVHFFLLQPNALDLLLRIIIVKL